MQVTFLFFAAAREAAGCARAELELPEGTTAGQAKALAVQRFPGLARLAPALQLAVDREIATPDTPLKPGAEVALLPPVAGGSGARVRLTEAPLVPAEVEALVRAPAFGAIATFAGTVREGGEQGRRVVRLEYEAYAPMALRQMAELAAALEAKHGARIALAHRTGALQVGEVAVVVCAGAPHRDAAFRACEEGIAALKAETAIWKREVYADGSTWIGLGARVRFPDDAPVTQLKREALKVRLVRLGVELAAVDEQAIRSRGPGGQKVNKTSSGVLLRYALGGELLVVKWTRERQHSLNRFLALRELADEIELRVSPGTSERLREIERIRRRKDRARRRHRA